MAEKCKLLHRLLEDRPLIKCPFELKVLPLNGIYFFYEEGEYWGHQGNKLRIVRIGTHKGDNFRSRISEHYLFNERKMDFDKDNQKPSDRSIFRKNIGRALLNKAQDDYLDMWNIDFTEKDNRNNFCHLRNIPKKKTVEENISKILRENFYFRFIEIPDEEKRIGKSGLEKSLIGTINQCSRCKPTEKWFGRYSPIEKIKNSGLWQTQHLNNRVVNSEELVEISAAVQKRSMIADINNRKPSINNENETVIELDWDRVWDELKLNLSKQPKCPIHSHYSCVRTLGQGIVNDITYIGNDGIKLRSHRTMREDYIEQSRFKRWWEILMENGQASLVPGAENNPHRWRSKIVGAIMGTCLPDRIRLVNTNLIELK